jgi:PTS system fructose-specific IIA component/PTS system nitrogen regulatory IIA component
MFSATSTDDGFPVRCEVCGTSSIVNVSRPPGDSVCPACGTFLWVTALVERTRDSFVPDVQISRLRATNRGDVLRELSQAIAETLHWTADQQAAFLGAVIKREELGSTGIGRGIAIPHASVDCVDTCFTVMALAPGGIPFEALDGKPVHTFVMVASPRSRPGDHLRLLESVSRSLRR